MQDRWNQFEMAYLDVKKAQDAYWKIITQLRAKARVSSAEATAAVQSMESAHRMLLELGRSLMTASSETLIWTSTREHP